MPKFFFKKTVLTWSPLLLVRSLRRYPRPPREQTHGDTLVLFHLAWRSLVPDRSKSDQTHTSSGLKFEIITLLPTKYHNQPSYSSNNLWTRLEEWEKKEMNSPWSKIELHLSDRRSNSSWWTRGERDCLDEQGERLNYRGEDIKDGVFLTQPSYCLDVLSPYAESLRRLTCVVRLSWELERGDAEITLRTPRGSGAEPPDQKLLWEVPLADLEARRSSEKKPTV